MSKLVAVLVLSAAVAARATVTDVKDTVTRDGTHFSAAASDLQTAVNAADGGRTLGGVEREHDGIEHKLRLLELQQRLRRPGRREQLQLRPHYLEQSVQQHQSADGDLPLRI